jgi:hypothetical protein
MYWPAFALRGRPLSATLSSPASAARDRVPDHGFEAPSVFEPPQ